MSLLGLFARARPRKGRLTITIKTVGTKAFELLKANSKRCHYVIKNLSDTSVYLGYNNHVGTSGDSEGILLTYKEFVIDDADTGAVWAIASATSRVQVLEVA